MTKPESEWLDALERPLALVFGGGASLGAIQVGMLRALLEHGVVPDLIIGTSVGALNAAFMAQRFDGEQLDRLEEIWRGVSREDIFPGVNWLGLARMVSGHRRYLASSRGLRNLVDEHLPASHAELSVPTTVMASDVLSGEKILLNEGNLREHVVISSSIPLIFEPVDHHGRTLVDGGVVANVPVLPASQLGAKSMIVLDPGYPCALKSIPADLLGFSLHLVTMMIRQQAHGALHFMADDSQVVYLPPPCPLAVSPHDFSRTDELVDAGYQNSVDFLKTLSISGPGIYGHAHFHDETVDE